MDSDQNASDGGPGHAFRSLVCEACTNRGQWLFGDAFAEASAFIDGFVAGLSAVNSDLASEWLGFRNRWLPRKLGYPPNHVWCTELRKRCPDGDEALERLRLLYLEYLAEAGPQEERGQ